MWNENTVKIVRSDHFIHVVEFAKCSMYMYVWVDSLFCSGLDKLKKKKKNFSSQKDGAMAHYRWKM